MDTDRIRLWNRCRRGDEGARNELVLAHLPLVRFVFGRLPISLPADLSKDDMLSVGVVALLRAIEGFDPARGAAFATYAVPRIRGAMLDELRAHDLLPRSVRQRATAIERALGELGREGNRAPAIAEIAQRAGLTPREVERTMSAVGVRSCRSLEASCRAARGGREHKILEAAADGATASPLAALMTKERDSLLTQAIADLPEPERRVITLYYQRHLMLKEIAEVLCVTKSRVSQIHTRALFRLRARIASPAPAAPPQAPSPAPTR